MKNRLEIPIINFKTKKLGFTLVEILAVIAILALIVSITIPIILNIIKKSRVKTYQRSVDSYGQAILKAISEYYLENEGVQMKISDIDDVKKYIKYNGNKVECDTIEIHDDKTIYLDKCKVNGEYIEYSYGMNEENFDSPISPICKSENNNISLEYGSKYMCKVNKQHTYTFYVLSLNNDNTVNLIMNRNMCSDTHDQSDQNHYCLYAWHENSNDTNYGPDSAMFELYEATKYWNYVPDIVINYTDKNNSSNFGYRNIITNIETKETVITGKNNKVTYKQVLGNSKFPLKARLPIVTELCAYINNNSNSICKYMGKCPSWITENLYNYDNPTYGYWLLSSYIYSKSYDGAYYLDYSGNVYRYNTDSSEYIGIRPVITVPISDLS